jgi:hypothetical protein
VRRPAQRLELDRPLQLLQLLDDPFRRREFDDLVVAAVDHIGRDRRQFLNRLVPDLTGHDDCGLEDIGVAG